MVLNVHRNEIAGKGVMEVCVWGGWGEEGDYKPIATLSPPE